MFHNNPNKLHIHTNLALKSLYTNFVRIPLSQQNLKQSELSSERKRKRKKNFIFYLLETSSQCKL